MKIWKILKICEVGKKKREPGPDEVRTGDLGEYPGTVSVLTTRPRCIGCYGSETCDYEQHASLLSEVKNTVSWWTPGGRNERIRKHEFATHATPSSTLVNDAGALAPVVFSGEENVQTCKITRIKRKRRPCPPKSDLLNPLVASVLTESACTGRFEASQFGNPKYGIIQF